MPRALLCIVFMAAVCSFCALAIPQKEVHEEFCQWDTFNISCSHDDQFVLVLSAQYGRMKVGRCVPIDYETGCRIDVLAQLEERCSGRRRCSMTISDSEIFRVQPCRKDLVPYLEVSYRCIDASGRSETTTCDGVIPVRDTSGYLSSHVMTNNGVGSERCPWLIEARPGQRLAITMKSFVQKTTATDRQQQQQQVVVDVGRLWSLLQPSSDPECIRVAEIRETLVSSAAHYLQLCPGDGGRRAMSYVSTSHSIQLNFIDNRYAGHIFLIHYEVVGCPDVLPPHNAWLTRNGDNLVVVCNYTSERWYIACSGRDWASQLSNCSAATSFPGVSGDSEQAVRNGSFPFGLLMAVAAGAIIGISIGFGCLLLLCIGRKRWKDRRHVQNAESSNRENVYKLIDLWAKPEIHCDCAVLQPEVTCDCAVVPDVRHHLHREAAGMEPVFEYPGGSVDDDPTVSSSSSRQDNPGCPNRCSRSGGGGGGGTPVSHHRGGGGGGDPSDPQHCDGETDAFRRHRATLQRCTCTSGKCRHHFVSSVVDELRSTGDEQCNHSTTENEGSSDLMINRMTTQRNSPAPKKKKTKTKTKAMLTRSNANSTLQLQKCPEKPTSN